MNRTCMNCNREYSCDWHAAGDRACCENWEPDIEAKRQEEHREAGKEFQNTVSGACPLHRNPLTVRSFWLIYRKYAT